MLGTVQHENTVNSDIFSAATLFYARLRRVTGRVVDALYLIENKDYAQYAIEIARQANDSELERLTQHLYAVLDLKTVHKIEEAVQEDVLFAATPESMEEVTPEEIYKAQVSHHYIGALR